MIEKIKWHHYDRSELIVSCSEHIGPFVKDVDFVIADICQACYCDSAYPKCDIYITDVYNNLIDNLSIVIALGAAADLAESRRGWRGPRPSDLREDGVTLRHAVPAYRWPFCIPDQHEICCLLHTPNGRYCDCDASAEEW